MPLTPADVHNVAFSKPPIGKRGYNEDEVDQFLDIVEAELGRLVEENADLQQRVDELSAELEQGGSSSRESREDRWESEDRSSQRDVRDYTESEPAVQAASEPVVSHAPGEAPATQETHIRAAHILAMAQEMADRLTNDARRDADQALGEARRNSDQLVAEARSEADRVAGDAQQRADERVREAESEASRLQAEAEQKHADLMNTINQQRAVLEGRIERLRTFEREYRTRLKSYLESQLDELGQQSSSAPSDASPAEVFEGRDSSTRF